MKYDEITNFLKQYPSDVAKQVALVRNLLNISLPNIIEKLDLPARMIAYCYGQRYIDMICTIFPSQKGVKLSFYRGVDLPDPEKILKGNAKTTRYVEIKDEADIRSTALKELLHAALEMYHQRMKTKS